MPDQMTDDREQNSLDYIRAAFFWQYNLIALGGAGLFAAASHSSLPIVLAAGFELMYLATVPQMARFRRMVRSWKLKEAKQENRVRLKQMYDELPQEMKNRYLDLGNAVRAITANYRRLSSTARIFVQQIEDRLEGLMQAYLRLLHSAHVHRVYLKTTDAEAIRRESQGIQSALERESPKVQEINRKRIEILKKRVEKYEKIRENCDVVDAQCAAIEDVLQLVRDQSVTMRDPQQITFHLDSLMQDVEHTEESVREVEEIFDMAMPDLAAATSTGPVLAPMPSDTSNGAPQPHRNRVSN
ncbi:MAG TPA: hypothetical protein VN428_13670 [Bryobacteraceae bacterium]|nr:hypothetical protein [Bryobacteraceae bacterium]